MKTVAVFEAKNRFSELLNAVEQGEEITITRDGRAGARMVSVATAGRGAPGQQGLVAGDMRRLRGLGEGVELGVPLAQAIGAGRD